MHCNSTCASISSGTPGKTWFISMKLQFYFRLQKGKQTKKMCGGNAWLSLFLKHCDGEFRGGQKDRKGLGSRFRHEAHSASLVAVWDAI